MENRKSVLLADASEEFRHLFAGALAEEDDIVLIGETGDGQEAVRLGSVKDFAQIGLQALE